jgi:hypothetical protein
MCTTLKKFSYLSKVQCVYHLAKMRTGEDHDPASILACRILCILIADLINIKSKKRRRSFGNPRNSWQDFMSDDSVNLLPIRGKNLGIILTREKVFRRPRSELNCSTFDWIEPFSKGHDPFMPEVQWLY